MKNSSSCKNNTKIDKNVKNRKILIGILLSFTIIPLAIFGIGVGIFALWANSVPLDSTLLPTQTALPTYYDIDGNKIQYQDDDYLSFEDIPNNLANAFIALEDKRFYNHKGYDVIRIGGAILSNLKSKSVKEGASTITQQLVKNTHLTNERTLIRKLKEIAIASKLEKEYSKQEILSMYLSVIYFGGGAYGVKDAARLYFDKDVDDLTLDECAMLAGIVKNPSKYNPFNDNDEPLNRRNLVLKIMRDEGYIDINQYESAISTPITCDKKEKVGNICDFYIKKAQDELCRALNITKYQLENSGMQVYTNLDMRVQTVLFSQAQDNTNRESDKVESVAIVLDNKNEAVIGYYSTLPYDIKRQAGSVLKPLAVYAPALDMNILSLCSPIVDERLDFGGYSPRNFGDKYYGDTNINEGIKKSMNSVAVRTLDYVGLDNSIKYLYSLGIEVDENSKNYALALGAIEVEPMDIANAYSTIANDGVKCKGKFIKYAIKDGVKVYDESENMTVKVLKTSTASLLKHSLKETVVDGTAKSLSSLSFEMCSKTGTAERNDANNSDAWNASFNDEYTIVIWHGSDSEMHEKGGGYPTRHALKIWQEIDKIMPQAKSVDCGKDTVKLDVDSYATATNKHVTLASENTPIEYRKSEFFSNDNIPQFISNSFDKIDEDIGVKVTNANGIITISFDTKSIYSYNVYRADAFGKMLIKSVDGKLLNGTFEMNDTPISFDKVEYEIECYITCNDNVKKYEKVVIFIGNT